MTEASPQRNAGRPRLYSDGVIFAAVHLVIRRHGYAALTLERVAEEVGCTRQALVRRFRTKREMVLEAVTASAEHVRSNFDQARVRSDSPLEALKTRFVQPPNSRPVEAMDVRAQANLLAFILTCSADPQFARLFEERIEIAGREIERLLEAAVAQGALEPTDTSALALVLQATWVGSTLYTSADAAIDQTATRAAIFEQVIGPYRRAAG